MSLRFRHLLPRAARQAVRDWVASVATEQVQAHHVAIASGRGVGQEEGAARAAASGKDLTSTETALDTLRATVEALRVEAAQLLDVVVEAGGMPPPPRHMQERVVGVYVPEFLASGHRAIDDIEGALAPAGLALSGFADVLDFGCGCGRVLRALRTRVPAARLYGTDIDGEAIAWLRNHCGRIAEFAVAPHIPPTDYADGAFDLVYGISVLTHLPEDMQFAWLAELRRIVRPGGVVVLTVHGETKWRKLPPDLVERMESYGFFHGQLGTNYGASIQLPDFYQSAFHSEAYVRREWARFFEVLDFQPLRMDRQQDTVLLRRPENG